MEIEGISKISNPPFPITIDVGDNPRKSMAVTHFYTGKERTPKDPRVDTHIFCWLLSAVMPDYIEGQVYWYTSRNTDLVTCQKCLEWLHA